MSAEQHSLFTFLCQCVLVTAATVAIDLALIGLWEIAHAV